MARVREHVSQLAQGGRLLSLRLRRPHQPWVRAQRRHTRPDALLVRQLHQRVRAVGLRRFDGEPCHGGQASQPEDDEYVEPASSNGSHGPRPLQRMHLRSSTRLPARPRIAGCPYRAFPSSHHHVRRGVVV